jgi:hypothetical protein
MNGTMLKYLKAVPLSKKFLFSLWTFLNNSEGSSPPPVHPPPLKKGNKEEKTAPRISSGK